MIICLGTTPAVQRSMEFDRFDWGEVNRATVTSIDASGKSINAARVLKTIGHDPLVCGFAGGAAGDFLRADLDRAGIAHDLTPVAAPTRTCVTVIDRGRKTTTELVEESAAVEVAAWDRLLAGLAAALPRADALLMSGSLAGGTAGPVDFYARAAAMAAAARDGGVPCILDCCGPALRAALAYRPAIIKPNRDELAKTIGADLHDDQHLFAAMADLLVGPQRAGAIVVTMGSSGAIAASSDGWWRIVPPRIQPVSPIGSGDAFAAGLAAGTVEHRALAESARYATALAAANALTPRPGWINLAGVEPLERATTVSPLKR